MSKPGSRSGRTHNAEGAREAILNAAEEIFAEQGFDGARIHAIAAASGYNKSLIFQYFGDKLNLYAEVIRRADEQTRVMQNEALESFLSTGTALKAEQVRLLLRRFVGWYFDYLQEHPRIQRIYMWEMAEGWQTMTKILTQRDFDDVNQFSPVLAKLQEVGLLRTGLNSLLQLSTALFTCVLYLSLPPFYKTLLPEFDFSTPAELALAREFIIEFIINGLLITPSQANP